MSSVMTTNVAYGESVWAKKAKQVNHKQNLNAAQRDVLIALTRAYRTTSPDALQIMAGVHPMDLELLKAAAEYCWRRATTDKEEELLYAKPQRRQQIKEAVHDMCQERWDRSVKGRRLYRLLPNVRERLAHIIHFLVGHDPYPQYLCDRGLSEALEHRITSCWSARHCEKWRMMKGMFSVGSICA
ncbi:hypothetical protein Trydic_g23497 [Trypoxylus dichotomus]